MIYLTLLIVFYCFLICFSNKSKCLFFSKTAVNNTRCSRLMFVRPMVPVAVLLMGIFACSVGAVALSFLLFLSFLSLLCLFACACSLSACFVSFFSCFLCSIYVQSAVALLSFFLFFVCFACMVRSAVCWGGV